VIDSEQEQARTTQEESRCNPRDNETFGRLATYLSQIVHIVATCVTEPVTANFHGQLS
jgi:hypothetical protein